MPNAARTYARERSLAIALKIRWSRAIEEIVARLSRSFSTEWAHQDSNLGPADYEGKLKGRRFKLS